MAMAASTTAAQAGKGVAQLAAEPRVKRALEWLDRHLDWIEEQHIKVTEIPAPTFEEQQRAAHLRRVFDQMGLRARLDAAGNVVAERAGESRDVFLLAAHIDTVFPKETDVRVRREGQRLLAPGVTDNSNGVAALLAVAKALQESRLRTQMTIVFAANVAEEGEGNLAGIRKLVETYRPRLRGVICIDGSSIEHITTRALASRRVRVTVSGPGGHSWSDFGLPNPIHALARGVARFVRVRIPDEPRTTFNVGLIEGGTSINSIPVSASMKVDLRSVSPQEIDRLDAALRQAMQLAVEEEQNAARTKNGKLDVRLEIIGERPGGELAPDAPLLAAVQDADRFLGLRSRLEISSTDANVPLSLGIPAISIGGGGRGGGGHSLSEWYVAEGREIGIKRILLTMLAITGVER